MDMWEYRYWYKQGNDLAEEIKSAVPGENELFVWYIGQSGFVFKRKNTIFYIDPVLSDLTDEDGRTRRYYPAPFDPMMVRADYIFCTHPHADHMALPTLCGIAAGSRDSRFVVPDSCIRPMTEAGISSERILEAKALETLSLQNTESLNIHIYPLAAAHPVHEKTDNGGDTALCYMIDFDGIKVLHTGDTYLTDQFYQNLMALPSPDLFIVPVNGSDYFRTARNCIGNVNALEAARLAVDLEADLTIPCHYDMVMDNTVDPLDFVRELRRFEAARRISRKWKLPELGEKIIVEKRLF